MTIAMNVIQTGLEHINEKIMFRNKRVLYNEEPLTSQCLQKTYGTRGCKDVDSGSRKIRCVLRHSYD
jgi:hypothetical protein